MKGQKYIAFYDLDHTILSANSAPFLVEESRKRGIMTPGQYRHAVWLSILYKLNLGDPVKMIGRMLTWLEGLKEQDIKNLCEEIYHTSIKLTLRPEILASFKKHRRSGAVLVLLSSATEPICDVVSEHLKLDKMICTRLETKNGAYTGRTDGKLVYGEEKKRRMHRFCIEEDSEPEKAWYYGDSYTDQYVMKAVGNPVAVSPDRKLKLIALRHNWPILTDNR